jgi:hypothetical protein
MKELGFKVKSMKTAFTVEEALRLFLAKVCHSDTGKVDRNMAKFTPWTVMETGVCRDIKKAKNRDKDKNFTWMVPSCKGISRMGYKTFQRQK